MAAMRREGKPKKPAKNAHASEPTVSDGTRAKRPDSERTVQKNGRKPAAKAAPERKASTNGPLILIVDDYQDAREMCAELLKYYGYRTALAATGQEAIDKAHELLPAVILMDLSLPGVDGWEATRRLKADPRTKQIPIIAVTGHALAGHSEGAREAGCDAFVTKPVLPDDLVAEVRRVLELSRNAASKSQIR